VLGVGLELEPRRACLKNPPLGGCEVVDDEVQMQKRCP